jgi:DUF4097 and DUF4098 domain-containing protein YvlB
MTISSAQYTITEERSIIVTNDLAAEEVHLHATNGKIYIGGVGVTTANGYELDSGDQVVLQNHTNAIYAIAASGTHKISVLVIQK